MHDDLAVRRGARRCLDSGGPHITLGRSDRWSGRVLAAPQIENLAHFGSKDNGREEGLIREAFAAFRATYVAGLEELAGDEQDAAPESAPTVKAVW